MLASLLTESRFLLYMMGFIFYSSKIPERWSPGSFDLYLHSHQWVRTYVPLSLCASFLIVRGGLCAVARVCISGGSGCVAWVCEICLLACCHRVRSGIVTKVHERVAVVDTTSTTYSHTQHIFTEITGLHRNRC